MEEFVGKFVDEDAQARKKLKTKTLDPLIFALDYKKKGLDFDWQEAATAQAIRKARENRIGDLHEQLFELLPGWERLPHGNAQPDLVCINKKIIVELKSREDTPKASDKPVIYDALKANLQLPKYEGYTAIFGFILNKSKKSMDTPLHFTPSHAKDGQRPKNEKILMMDGRLLWSFALGKGAKLMAPPSDPDAIFRVYEEVLDSIFRVKGREVEPDILRTLLDLQKSNFTKPETKSRKKSK
jgi:hypothetical protein